MRLAKLAPMFLLCLSVACGGSDGDDDDDNTADAAVGAADAAAGTADAAAGTADAAVAATCYIDPDLGTPTLSSPFGEFCGMQDTPDIMQFGALVSSAADSDSVFIELYKGYGVFTDAITPGTYELTGAELNYATCAVCVRMFAGDAESPMDDNGYFATGGSVTITSLNPLQGTFSNITLQHVNIADMTFESTPHPDGCTSAITSGSFDVATTLGTTLCQ